MPKITQNVPIHNYGNCKSEINVGKSNSQSIPENLDTNENNGKVHIGNDNHPITQSPNKTKTFCFKIIQFIYITFDITAIPAIFAAIHINDSPTKQSIPKIKKGQITEFTLENIPYRAVLLSRAGKARLSYKNAYNVYPVRKPVKTTCFVNYVKLWI